jgi:hypothetical protein
MIQLTQQQHEEMQRNPNSPIRAVDPATNAEYVLLRADVYDRLKAIVPEEEQSWGTNAYSAAMEVFARDGWDDPAMDVYDTLSTGEPL